MAARHGATVPTALPGRRALNLRPIGPHPQCRSGGFEAIATRFPRPILSDARPSERCGPVLVRYWGNRRRVPADRGVSPARRTSGLMRSVLLAAIHAISTRPLVGAREGIPAPQLP